MTVSESVIETGESPERATASRPDAASGDPAVVVDGLRKSFGSGTGTVTAVDGVSLTIEQGSVVGFLGPNGAGKTTLIKSILGMVIPDEGEVHIDGVDARASPRAAYADVDAMLEGARNDYWRLTVRENLRYFTTVSGVEPDSVVTLALPKTGLRDLDAGLRLADIGLPASVYERLDIPPFVFKEYVVELSTDD